MAQFPPYWGMNFTPTIHNRAEGPTDPANIKLHANFVVAVTGAGKGLGRQIALSYARAGAKGIVIASRTEADLRSLEAEIKNVNATADVLSQPCDTQSSEHVKALAKATKERFGRLDAVIANAGIISKYITKEDGKEYMPVGVVEEDDFERVINTNLIGSWRVANQFVPFLQDTKDGVQAFVVITSIASHMNKSEMTPIAYNLSKICMNRLAEHIHADHFEKDGIQAFAVHPGAVMTEQTKRHHETQLGQMWTDVLTDDDALCGGFLTWLTSERREWLSGRYLSANWDTKELEDMKEDIVGSDKLVMRMTT
ncbi:Putative short-chain dehydrogenase/reductase SDR, NAD(P)-binding domain superfamily [Septoria linicola]|uniref:Short-chain dehydrogenase/reductase SDR, NAD(P)-binding domain superfamily n=1 Tax=Septoria linicola TaxID=215465 RepID=A0A9Q9APR0_9PEZI|nr:putative short-chain dehydrogenase/reductase SDR, NAD(P)-binding domain superfamily [Septoria linicola]USW50873.1 Putative short-chain dehydrogenase/reductase SDR, NAD(P)-binding domain superfamily [Septoria linicola]